MTPGSFFAAAINEHGQVVILMSPDIAVTMADKFRDDGDEFAEPLLTLAAQLQARIPTERPAA